MSVVPLAETLPEIGFAASTTLLTPAKEIEIVVSPLSGLTVASSNSNSSVSCHWSSTLYSTITSSVVNVLELVPEYLDVLSLALISEEVS